MEVKDLVFVDGARTPMAEFNASFAGVSAIDLGAHAAKAALERSGVEPGSIDHTLVGNALQTSPDAIYGARHVALKAGVPIALSYMDYGRKTVGYGPMLWPSGDEHADVLILAEFYAGKQGRNPGQETPPSFG